MGIGIKTRHFTASKATDEKTWEEDGVGWSPDYVAKSKGRGTLTTSKRYQDNYDKIDWSKK